MKLYIFIICSYAHKNVKRHLIAFNYCKVAEFFVRPPSDFCTFKNLRTEKTALK